MKDNYNPEEIEDFWIKKWSEDGTYNYRGNEDSDDVFSIDTPPPTVSGNLHFGHTYGNTLTDFKARFERMKGNDVFFPFGFDNNGIASERLTERELGINHGDFERKEFKKKVRSVCEEYQKDFEKMMKTFGFSMDWDQTYETIEPGVQRISQLSFIELYEDGREYRKKAPAIWCPDCETAISQVETEDKEKTTKFNDIEFELSSGNGSLIISTTRPELLPACVAIFVHPEDETNNHLVGEKAEVPLFDYEVPIMEDDQVDMEMGTGVVMCCTFGDQRDIEWYKEHDLDLRVAIDESGTMTELAEDYEGLSTEEAQKEILNDLEKENHLLDKEQITHTVGVHERCEEEIEFLVTEQWYVKLLDKKDEYLEAGKQLDWNPEKMFTRYEHWIEGLKWDWCISRQRDSGIPFPVWYHKETGEPVLADKDQLPVDPTEDEPPVENPEDYEPETDVFDTWATSSLTPLINAGWDGEKLERPEIYPMDVRPQGHDIISFWLFHTIVKCYEHTGTVPFESVMINGMVLDENKEKMSKSKGNVVLPQEVLEDYPVDAARYWSGGAAVGDDLAFKEKDLKAGEKLMRKIWNASKLVGEISGEIHSEVELDPVDRWILAETDRTVDKVTEYMENYEFRKARNELRKDFWNNFCDNYLEIAKQRMDEEGEPKSTSFALRKSLEKYLKMFAPIMPFITEEIYREIFSDFSIHQSEWPEAELAGENVSKGRQAMQVLGALRKFKSDNRMAPNENLNLVKVFGEIEGFEEDLIRTMHIDELKVLETEPDVERKIKEIKLDYENAGPKYGEDIGKIEQALSQNEFTLTSGTLNVAGHHLKPEEFIVEEELVYDGQAEVYSTEDTIVLVK